MRDYVEEDQNNLLSQEAGLLRLREMDRLCRKILSQVPGTAGHRDDAIPVPLADRIASCDCATLYSILRVCLLRLIGEAVVPCASADAPNRGKGADGP